MERIINNDGMDGTIEALLRGEQAVIVPTAENAVEAVVIKAQLAVLTDENNKLKAEVAQKQGIIEEREATIEKLNKRVEDIEEGLKTHQEKHQADEAKIDKLSYQLQKVQKLLQKLLSKNTVSKPRGESNPYSSPHGKVKPSLDLNKIREKETYNVNDNYLGSYRSSKTEYVQSTIHNSPNIQLVNSSYTSKLPYSPSPNYGKASNFQTDEYKRYRRQKILASQNVSDILKIQKLMNN